MFLPSTRHRRHSFAWIHAQWLTCAAAGLLLCPIGHAAERAIYHCKAQGVTTFSDRPCDAAAQVYEVDTSRISSYTPEPMATSKAGTAARRPAKKRAKSSIAADQARRATECAKVNSSLKDIRQKMRSGYSAREGERLRERQSRLEEKRRSADCR